MNWTKIIKATTKIKVIKNLENRIRLLFRLKLKTTRELRDNNSFKQWNNEIRKSNETVRINILCD